MAREFARAFYHSRAWKRTRAAYVKYRHGLCERCMRRGVLTPGEIVHHKEHLTPRNINDQAVALGFANLELVCRECHAAEHPEVYGQVREQRVAFDADGNVVRLGAEDGFEDDREEGRRKTDDVR